MSATKLWSLTDDGEAKGAQGSLANGQEEKLIKSSYTGIPDSMLRHEYQVSISDRMLSKALMKGCILGS